jgi:hypothetical protein
VFPAIVAVPAVTTLGGCSLFGQSAAAAPDPLPGIADAARADAALAASVIAADPSLRARLEPLRAARAAHAAALDQMLGRPPSSAVPAAAAPPATPGARPTAGAPATGAARASKTGVTQLHDALVASAAAASDAALVLPTGKVGLVASVAACCSTYAALL